ncbi:ribosomal-processing cysteine protease Prp [Acetilactobacillus jinshanensis]|uniref:Ribosomal processing cysteine protease Prp n=1 Tax=Acetilactobacillus jinshanensis TaxID=1720083 RepID=A0A4V1ALS7_9LACO|nr:ribosomal-processing cysteine protease Prp [Acetilactobacillus jinshanensis]QBP18639.1 ribosomal-processing cysteine protease Prp [Acetilactobacillus jinshanensis]URL61515.1 ribosomal-processing cysteine protease Prp [uncultured bacterium]
MIRATVIYHNHLINGFKLIGHANSANYGHDIVCAAVSALSITTVNSLSSLASIKPQVKQDQVNGGLLIVKIPEVHDYVKKLKVQTLLQSFELGIKMIADRYHRYIKLNIIR